MLKSLWITVIFRNSFKGQFIRSIKVNGKQMRKFGFTQISVAIDLYGDVLFREASFLNREGKKKDN